ncbi:MAG: SAM-dependent methyltransferase [Flavobacteriales bacterium]|jgi:16S rRNA (cytidine1402-2'-O)-methyltransferase|nr:SAM-dependent methyltransferase [Flavobacteriales bacterium]MBK6752277.1 SAM-dependent methyltransferase [Flavobacteriales bacterium]MBK7084604.1 SAM-dependent methyltransferase [Flavobacteriales bacterium]MBK7752269.1 SAM-dependent methyltransferase [Flavobacteriales bacterium]MBK9074249.1 SAM-dependent methyltransferase [Flavobacteriales bacterium]
MSVAEGYGTLYLMPVWLGDHGGTEQIPSENIVLATRIDLWFCEHERTARHMLRRMVPLIELPRMEMHRLDKDSSATEVSGLLGMMKNGRDAAIVSEAGMPGIADPGAQLVAAAHVAGVRVVPLIGPSSLFLALAASGSNGQHFTFHGYLPVKPPERKQAIKRIEQDAIRTGAAQIFIETPYRNDTLLGDLLTTCAPSTSLTIAIDLTQPRASVRTLEIVRWKKEKPELGKRPAVFILSAGSR